MKWWRRRRRDPEIAPDEIFLDASNTPSFDRARFEGRIEKPLSRGAFIALAATLALVWCVLLARAWHLEITNGAAFAVESAHNSLAVETLFAPRGAITDVNGVMLAENVRKDDGSMVRNYPLPSASSVVGYVSYPKKDARGVYYDTDTTGIAGIEARYDALLAGKNGQLLTERDVFGRVRSEGVVVPAKAGRPLRLSIDANLQRLLARAVSSVARDKRFIAGAGVILDARTGAVRALVSFPSYDSGAMTSGTPDAIARYAEDPGRPFLDHATQGVYTPGSVVKPFAAAGALTDGLIAPDTVIDDQGSLSLPDPYHPGKTFVYKGWKALGPVDVRKAIAWSSDIFFYTVGGGFGNQKGLGADRLEYWYRQFGLGSPTGINVSGEAAGLIPTPEWKEAALGEPWYLGDTYFTAIGQYAMQVTPLQMARATAAIANGGKLLTPTLLTDADPSFVVVPASAEALAVVREGMRQTVTTALATALNLPYMRIAAKTGTAQTGTRNQYDNSWVEGFFPYEDPQYAFAVVLERGPEGAGSQAVNAMREFFDSLRAENSPYLAAVASDVPAD